MQVCEPYPRELESQRITARQLLPLRLSERELQTAKLGVRRVYSKMERLSEPKNLKGKLKVPRKSELPGDESSSSSDGQQTPRRQYEEDTNPSAFAGRTKPDGRFPCEPLEEGSDGESTNENETEESQGNDSATEETEGFQRESGDSSPLDDQELLSRKRKMNIIYSRRKREKKKMQVDALTSRGNELRQDNEYLDREAQRLNHLIKEAEALVAQIESLPVAMRNNPSLHSFASHPMTTNALYHTTDFAPGLAASRLGALCNPTHRAAARGPASDSLALLSRLQAASSYAAVRTDNLQFAALAAMGGGPSLAHRGLSSATSQFGDSVLAQQFAFHQERKRLALLEYTAHQDAIKHGALLRQGRQELFPTRESPTASRMSPSTAFAANLAARSSMIPSTRESSLAHQLPSQEDHVTNLLISHLLLERQNAPTS
jgi:hypothetical protein